MKRSLDTVLHEIEMDRHILRRAKEYVVLLQQQDRVGVGGTSVLEFQLRRIEVLKENLSLLFEELQEVKD